MKPKPAPNRGQPRPPKYRCSKCEQVGHNAKTCEQISPSERKKLQILAEYELGLLQPPKNQLHWERIAQGKAAVLDHLEQALGTLSERAPAYSYIMAALNRLEDIR